jgi:hypothetical protein
MAAQSIPATIRKVGKNQAIAPIRAMEGGTYVHCMANAGTFFWLNAATHVTG